MSGDPGTTHPFTSFPAEMLHCDALRICFLDRQRIDRGEAFGGQLQAAALGKSIAPARFTASVACEAIESRDVSHATKPRSSAPSWFQLYRKARKT